MTFAGIPLAALDFYEDLEVDNSKAFWTAHKDLYDGQVRAPLEALAHELGREFGEAKLFRPYRDVRFSKDKTPYKTHQGAWFAESSRYVHVSAAGLFLGGGYWSTSSAQVGRYRTAVDGELAGPPLERIAASLRRKGFRVGGDQLSRVPAGFDKDHPRADLLRYKTWTAGIELGAPDWLSTPASVGQIRTRLRALGPLIEWLDAHVGRG